jgi:hypothetical protein
MSDRPGCLSGLLKLFLLDKLLDFLQDRFGFGRGASCGGCGCGVLIFILGLVFTCSILFSTNWFDFGF